MQKQDVIYLIVNSVYNTIIIIINKIALAKGWMIRRIKYSVQYFFLAELVFFFVSGCSITGEVLKPKESIAVYAESLFKRQNLLTQQLMMLPEEDMTLADEESVYQAEIQMHDACRLLNEYASRDMEGKAMSVFFRTRVKNSFKSCEEGVKNMESVLQLIE